MFAPREDWSRAGVEPSLEDVINDPVVRLVMRRDNVAPADLLKMLAHARAHVAKPVASPRNAGAPLHRRRVSPKD